MIRIIATSHVVDVLDRFLLNLPPPLQKLIHQQGNKKRKGKRVLETLLIEAELTIPVTAIS